MKKTAQNLIITLISTLMLNIGSISAQNEIAFPNQIESTTTLSKGTYIIKGTCIVSPDAKLIAMSGTKFVFEPSAILKVLGGLEFIGEAGSFIEITSKYNDLPGIGMVFYDNSDLPVTFAHCKFSNLKKPIKFNKNWSRKSVNIVNSQFSELHSSGVYVEFQEIDKIMTDKLVNINIDGNTFSNNTGSILISEASWELLQVTITNNVFSRNEFIGRELNGIFTTPIFLNYNVAMVNGREPIIKQNSICYNYGSLMMEDTVEFFPTNLTVIGNADYLNINQNYFGDNAKAEFDHFMEQISSSRQAPLLIYDNLLSKPGANLNGHIYKVGVNGVRTDNVKFDIVISGETNSIELISNKPVVTSPDFKISYIYLSDDTLRYEALGHNLEFSSGNLKTEIDIKDRILNMKPNGFIKIEGLKDENGFTVPTVNIGLKNFLIENRIFVMGYNDFVKVPKLVQSTPRVYYTAEAPVQPTSTADTGDLYFPNELADPDDTLLRQDYWDIGLHLGTTMYFGDLTYTNVALYLPSARPNIGFRLGYNLTEKFRLEISQNNMMISGADDRTSIIGAKRGTNYARGLSFRTMIYDLGVIGEYKFNRFKKMKTIIPSVFGGVAGYYFNPQAEVDGIYYNLRPIGTEGQTANGSLNSYSKFSVAIPMGFKLSRHLGKNTIFSVSYTYNKLFTDYLDDVSTGTFQADEQMIANNPDLGNIAVKLGNPKGIAEGTQRSSSAAYDGYSYFGFTLTRKLAKKL